MRVAVLGPLRVTGAAGEPSDVAGARLRALLIRLALEAGRAVGSGALIDAVWGQAPPSGAANALQSLVSRLRQALPEPARLVTEATGYRLELAPGELDAAEFEELATAGRKALSAGDGAAAVPLLRRALALWRGPALADVADAGFAAAPAARLAAARLAATEDLIEAELPGGGADLPARCAELIEAEPLRERPYGLLIRALHDAGRPAEALQAYERLRRTLADGLGTDPSPELAALHLAILRGEPRRGGNLPAPATSFVGRAAEQDRLRGLLAGARLVTLVGPGGAGKTRLAVETGRSVAADFADGVWLVELAPVAAAGEVTRALAEALSLRFPPGGAGLRERLLAALAGKSLALILDNCEHLIDECARLADAVLARCPDVRLVATSREPLNIAGETLCPVGPLRTEPAVRLFLDRAAAVRPGFSDTDTVTQICRRLDGLPLAIELAAARLRTLPVAELAARLDDRFRLLTGGSRVALPRHRTLQAVVDWSWDLLTGAEHRLARRFAVFQDGATVDAVVEVCGGDLDTLAGLVDRSLIGLAGDRYRMLETIRAYAAERLAESGEADRIRAGHARYFRDLAEAAEPKLRGREQIAWLARLTTEWENLIAALRWAVESADADTAVRLGAALGWFWSLRSAHAEAAGWLSQCLAVPGASPRDRRALAQTGHAVNLVATGDVIGAREAFAAAAGLGPVEHPYVKLGPPLGAILVGDVNDAWDLLDPLLADEDPWARAMGRMLRGAMQTNAGKVDEAEADLTAALERFRELGDRWGVGVAVAALAEPRGLRGDLPGAIALLEESLACSAELGVDDDMAQVLFGLSQARLRLGDLAGARADLERAVRHAASAGSPTRRFMLCAGAGELARRAGDLVTAAREYRAALAELDGVRGLPAEWRSGSLLALAKVATAGGDLPGARELVHQAIETLGEGNRDRGALAVAAEVAAGIALAAGFAGAGGRAGAGAAAAGAEAARMLGVAEAVRGLPDRGDPEVVALTASAREAAGEAFAAAYAAGAAEPPDSVMDVLTSWDASGRTR